MDFNARQYDPQIGRFLSVDPLAASGGQESISPYAAMGNMPESLTDPEGTIAGLPFTMAGKYMNEVDYNPGFYARLAAFLFGGDGITGEIARQSGWACGFSGTYGVGGGGTGGGGISGGAFWGASWAGMTGIQLYTYYQHASPYEQAQILTEVYHSGYFMGEYQRQQSTAQNYNPDGGGHIALNLSNAAWYDGDGDGKAGVSGNRPDEGGRPPTKEEADRWYESGKGDLYVNLSKLDLSHLHPSDFNFRAGTSKSINLIRSRDFDVFGHITLTYTGRLSVFSTFGYDNYDFEMHPWSNPGNWVRNFETILGSPGSGTPYRIYLYGEASITPDAQWYQNLLNVFDVPYPH